MIKSFNCAQLSVALEKLKSIVKEQEEAGRRTVIFCEDRLSLAAERAVCAAVDGTFSTSVFSFARFLSAECGKNENLLSSQGSAMAVRAIIEENRDELTLLKKLPSSSAAQSVYDTIALLYSSRISAEDAAKAAERGGLLGGKLRDVSTVYKKYREYLETTGKEDRNGYLSALAPVIESSVRIKGSAVIFLGFQALTTPAVEAVSACFATAADTYGLFIGGDADVYVNEAIAKFNGAAKPFGGARTEQIGCSLCADADVLRKGIFNPESYHLPSVTTNCVHIIEAADGQDELEFIAARIKKYVQCEGERYAKISVMLPDLDVGVRELARVFSSYKIPFYADRRLPLATHPLCNFIVNYLLCALSGCRPQNVDCVVSSPYFPAERRQKDVFRNYLLRLCNYRGGVKKLPSDEILESFKFEKEAVLSVRETFLRGLSYFSKNPVKSSICGGLLRLFDDFKVQKRLEDMAEEFKDLRPVEAQFCLRAYDGVLAVLNEAETLAGGMGLSEYIKVLKSGFAAAEISLIPPKADAVFVGDLSATANTGSDVVFAARLTGDVPGATADTAMLTDREIDLLESAGLSVAPKIEQVNARRRETCALNVCAFRKELYLSYPARLGGEECTKSEIISYAQALFCSPSYLGDKSDKDAAKMPAVTSERIEKSLRSAPFYSSEPMPALKRLQRYSGNAEAASIVEVLNSHGYARHVALSLSSRKKKAISCGKRLYPNYNSLSPTALETYFSCPYLAFMRQGLRVREREEGVVRPVDTGNFIHSVLQDVAPKVGEIETEAQCGEIARQIAEEKLKKPPYSSLLNTKSGEYTAGELIDEAGAVSLGMYEQLKNSRFTVKSTETKCEIPLVAGVKLFGRIDRVDECGDMVRIIDYKTGTVDATPSAYFVGAKLQLPLYLSAVSDGKRAVGAYYFPAAVEYTEKKDGVFRLQGFMDGSAEVVSASDSTLESGQKSRYVNAYLEGRSLDSALPREAFDDFLYYSRLVAGGGARELLSGNILPSPSAGTCKYCKAGGSCNFTLGKDGEERDAPGVKCADIAEIAKKARGGGDE